MKNANRIICCPCKWYYEIIRKKKALRIRTFVWAHLDLNQGPPDYESGALTD